jgi:nitroreductase
MQDIFETIKTRRSIRKYKKEIPDESGLMFKHV